MRNARPFFHARIITGLTSFEPKNPLRKTLESNRKATVENRRGMDAIRNVGIIVRPDKRRYLRYEILDYAVVDLDGESRRINTVVADISLGGVQLRSKEPFPVGTMCTIRVGGGPDEHPIGLRAEIRHCRPIDFSELFTTGMKFMPETHADRMAIAEYVHSIFQRQCDNLLV